MKYKYTSHLPSLRLCWRFPSTTLPVCLNHISFVCLKMAHFMSVLGLIWGWRWDAAAWQAKVSGWVGGRGKREGGSGGGGQMDDQQNRMQHLMFIKAMWLKDESESIQEATDSENQLSSEEWVMNYESARLRVSQTPRYLQKINSVRSPKRLWQPPQWLLSALCSSQSKRHRHWQLLNSCAPLSRAINHRRAEWDQCVSKRSAEKQNSLHFTACEPTPEALACCSAWS